MNVFAVLSQCTKPDFAHKWPEKRSAASDNAGAVFDKSAHLKVCGASEGHRQTTKIYNTSAFYGTGCAS